MLGTMVLLPRKQLTKKMASAPTPARMTRPKEVIPALGYTFTETVVAPTCTEDGYTLHTCNENPAKTYKDTPVAALGHQYKEVTTPATCGALGSVDNVCERCNDKQHVRDIPVNEEHQWDEGVITKEPTATEPGIKTYTCTVCGASKTEVIPATDHDTELVGAKDATCTEDGYTGNEVCKVCQTVVKQGEVIPALGHDYKDGKCSRCGAEEPTTPVEPGKPGDSGKPTTPEKPAEPSQPTTPDTPATGDSSNMTALWVVLAVAGLGIIALVVLLVTKRSKKQNG